LSEVIRTPLRCRMPAGALNADWLSMLKAMASPERATGA
jgi:hypothetical protein